jgi:glycerol-3-phosphate cytidylyltransferase
MKKLYTGGTFDIFHYGHVNFLRQCSKLAEEIIVSLNTDEFIQSYKGVPPIMSYNEREKSLRSCKYVSDVIPNVGGSDSKPAILSVKPDIIAIGDDWAKKDYYKQMQFTQKWLDENNILLVYLAYTEGISTTEIKNRIKNGLQ